MLCIFNTSTAHPDFQNVFRGLMLVFCLHSSFNEEVTGGLQPPLGQGCCVLPLRLTLHRIPLNPLLRYSADAHWCAWWLYRAKDTASVLAVWCSDDADGTVSLENLMQAVLVLLTEDVQKPWKLTALMPLHSLALANYLAHLSIYSVHFSVWCSFLTYELLRNKFLQLS